MPEPDERIVDRIKKLLRLAQSDNVNEAANAAGQAQRLMEQHRIDQALLDVSDADGGPVEDEDVRVDGEPMTRSGRLPQWKVQLGVCVANANACRCYLDTRWNDDREVYEKSLCIVGRPSDVATVRYLFTYLAHEIERLCKRDGQGRGRTYANSFRIGAVHTIRKRLVLAKAEVRKEAKKKLRGDSTALAKIDKALAKIDQRGQDVDDWMDKNMDLSNGRASRSRRDWDAYRAGQQAGHGIELGASSSSLKSGAKALGSGKK